LDEGFGSQSNVSETKSASNNQTIPFKDQLKINIKRAVSIENLRSISTSSNLNRNIQRCAVSRRISTAQVREEIHLISSRSNNQSLTITGPLRAFHMPTINTNQSSVKFPRKSSSVPRHPLTVEKAFASRTVLTTVLPSSILLKKSKEQ
jgi:hypothetical protein